MSRKPTEQEEEYLARIEFERRKTVLHDRNPEAAEAERRRTLSVATGRCPRCGAALVPVPYRGVELDKCSRCQGVWLDVGELDQVVTDDTGLFGSLRRIFS
jgi:hypothetical protein